MTSRTLPDPPAGGLLLSVDLAAGRIVLAGELDRGTVGHLAAACRMLADAAPPAWVMDVAALDFCDAPGVRALVAVRRAAEEAGAVMLIVGARPLLRRLLPLAGLGDVLAPLAQTRPAPLARRVGRPAAGLSARATRSGSPAAPARCGGAVDANGRTVG